VGHFWRANPVNFSIAPKKAGNKTLTQVDPLKVRFYFDVSKTLRPNPYDAPGFKSLDQVPLVEREYNRCDPDNPNVLYLRGVRQSVGDEKMNVAAEFTEPESGKVRRGEVPVTVVRGSLGGTTPGGAVIEDAILDAAARTGVPPQFMKAQVYFETGFDPTKYRYEPMTIDFVNVSGDVPDGSGVLSRDNTTYGPYIRKHMYQGSAVLAPNLTDPSRTCAVLFGLNAAPTPAETEGCIVLDGRTAHTTELPIRGVETKVVGRQGLPGQTGYQLAHVKASRLTYLPPDQQGPPAFVQLGFIEAPRWTVKGGNAVQAPTHDQFWVDYSSNKVRLGRELTEGEWVRITYHVVPEEEVGTGATCNTLDPARLNGKTEPNPNLTFQPGDTVASWLLRNVTGKNPDGSPIGGNALLTGTEMEKSVEFRLDMNLPPGSRRVGLMDSRFRGATAQFIAAGSFGLTHFTIKPWLNRNLAAVLNKAFDLNARCLYHLADGPTREADALAATAAYHSFNYQRPSCTQCDQVDWVQNWAKVINRYNSADDKYQVRGGLSEITRRGVTVYDAQ
jgi:hypothetical protein